MVKRKVVAILQKSILEPKFFSWTYLYMFMKTPSLPSNIVLLAAKILNILGNITAIDNCLRYLMLQLNLEIYKPYQCGLWGKVM